MKNVARKINLAVPAPDLHKQPINKRVGTPSSNNDKKANGKRKKIKDKLKIFDVGLGVDIPLLIFTLALVVIGVIMMFSASYVFAYAQTGKSTYYLTRQLGFAIVGVILMIIFSYFNYQNFTKWRFRFLTMPRILVAISIGLLLLVLVIGKESTGVSRWINIGPLSFQPSEIAKFALILFMADYAARNIDKMGSFLDGVVKPLILVAVFCALLVLEPHYSCTIIVIMLAAIMMFLSGVKIRYFAFMAILLGIAIIIVNFTVGFNYFMDRLGGWGNTLEYESYQQWQDTWQTRNSLYAIGSGGIWGLGLGQSRQKYLYLPEPQNDFVFSIVCEELGLVGATIIILLFALLVWRGITVSMRAETLFGRILGTGIMAQIGLQVILNILVITDSLPNTGISLPFFSYGGTSILMLLFQMSIVLSISRNSLSEKV